MLNSFLSFDSRSYNLFLKEGDQLTLHRHPVAQSTDAIRGRVGYERGLHLFEVTWPSCQRGTHAVVGVGTGNAMLLLPPFDFTTALVMTVPMRVLDMEAAA